MRKCVFSCIKVNKRFVLCALYSLTFIFFLNLILAAIREVGDVLQRAHISNAINLNDFWLNSVQLEVIFKAIWHQNNIGILDLSNNCIKNDVCRQLGKSLSTLKQLKTLNLKGNFITADGLDMLLSYPGVEQLPDIVELILSQNPLNNTCLRTLDRFCNSTCRKSLQKLHLSQCQLTNLYDYDLCFHQLLDFDISFNQLEDESIRNMLQKLNSCRIQNLNLNYIKKEQSSEDYKNSLLADTLCEFFESGTCEKIKNIELVGCQLLDVNIYKIVQCLSRANDLELLNISNNSRLSYSSLHFIFDKLPQLRKLFAINCTNLIDPDKLDRLTISKHLPNFVAITLNSCYSTTLIESLKNLWHLHWGERGMTMAYGNNYVLYTNEKDLICVNLV